MSICSAHREPIAGCPLCAAMFETREAQIDRLIHDAEHAEAGRDFARMMTVRDPTNPVHAEMAATFEAKARELREEAAALKGASS